MSANSHADKKVFTQRKYTCTSIFVHTYLNAKKHVYTPLYHSFGGKQVWSQNITNLNPPPLATEFQILETSYNTAMSSWDSKFNLTSFLYHDTFYTLAKLLVPLIQEIFFLSHLKTVKNIFFQLRTFTKTRKPFLKVSFQNFTNYLYGRPIYLESKKLRRDRV